MTSNNTTRATASAMPLHIPTPAVQLETEVAYVARMASILADMIADGVDRNRARSIEGTSVTLTFQEEGLLDLEFAAEELRTRTKKIVTDYDALRDRGGAA